MTSEPQHSNEPGVSRADLGRRLGQLAVAILLLISAVVAVRVFLQSDNDRAASIPPSDRQMPISGQVLESDRPDLLEEPGLQSNGEEPAVELPQVRVLSEQDLVDMLVGACIQSTRNCDPAESISRVKQALADGKEFKLISTENFPDDWMVVAVQGLGGGGAWEYVIERTREQDLPTIENPRRAVVDLLSDYIGQDFKALVRSEAAGATATALLLAAEMGIPTLDAGITGRAVPEVQQSIPWISGIASIPTAIVTQWGDQIIIKHAVDEYRVEDIGRAIAVASGGGAIITMAPMSGAQLDKGVIPGNLSEALLFGRTVREAREAGKDPVAALVDVANGYELFRGVVTKSDERGDRGFNWVDAELQGTGDYEGHTYRIYVKNENIVAWLDDQVDVMSPDYIYNLDPATGESNIGVGIGGYVIGDEVVMVGVPAPWQWRRRASS